MNPNSSEKPKPRGILKNPLNSTSERPTKLKWDEDNLLLTEAQKDSTMKIDEPKTPYVRYDHENDLVLTDLDSIPDMSLNGPISIPSQDIDSPPSGAHAIEENDWSEEEEEEEEDEETKEKHERFLKMRAQHYHMGDALKHPVELEDERPAMEMDEDL
ncbi:hypothetical protein K7432_009686 [Basidiobolus ranarum]|uniref:Protein phosphatase inhibitor 2 n=1 Tax=Basidiobolus ranarum TaxID=34480 RepID=A0ABR2WQ27_9FUNG